MSGFRVSSPFLPVVYMLALMVLSSVPGERDPLRNFLVFNVRITNILHVPAFTVLFVMWFMAFASQERRGLRRRYIYPLVISFAYGLFLEAYQFHVPGRFPSLGDVILNAAGIGTGTFIVKWRYK